MAYERLVKRMDDAVESSWLRGLRSQSRPTQVSAAQRFIAAPPRRKPSLGKLDRTVAAGTER